VAGPNLSIPHNSQACLLPLTRALSRQNWDGSPNSQDPIGHGTHVSSSVAGNTNGNQAQYNGLAPQAKIAFFDIAKYDSKGNIMLYPPGDLNNDMFVRLYNAGARVLSMSWGSPDSNCYSSYAVMVDEFMWNRPDALVVFAAGNSGQAGEYSVVTPSTAKSCLTVGASYNVMQSSFGMDYNINYVAYFSSIGPTADGRLKPDVVAPGYYITSAHNGESCGVVMSRGTSMATPVTASNAILLRQYFMSGRYKNHKLTPSGSLLKAMIIHSGQKMNAYENDKGVLTPLNYPDKYQGYGRIQLDQVLDQNNRFTLLAYGGVNASDPYYRQFNKEGDVHEYQFTITNSSKIRPIKVRAATPGPGLDTFMLPPQCAGLVVCVV
jgi:serine protease AprX